MLPKLPEEQTWPEYLCINIGGLCFFLIIIYLLYA